MPQKSFCQLPFILSSNKRYCNSPQLCVCVNKIGDYFTFYELKAIVCAC